MTQADVVVIGGGVIGYSICWRLGQTGMRAIVVERGRIGDEASHAAGGMLVPLAEALLAPTAARAISELIIRGESSINLSPFSAARFTPRLMAG